MHTPFGWAADMARWVWRRSVLSEGWMSSLLYPPQGGGAHQAPLRGVKKENPPYKGEGVAKALLKVLLWQIPLEKGKSTFESTSFSPVARNGSRATVT